MKNTKRLILPPFVPLLLATMLSYGISSHPITIDGLWEDWGNVAVSYSDPIGDGISEDFGELKITNDNDFVFFSLMFHDGEHLMQDWNEIHLYLDTDNNINTGLPIYGIGAELDWCFGCRSGEFHVLNDVIEIYQNDLTLRSAPTITSDRFELCISRSSIVMTINGTQEATNISVALAETDENGDILPDSSGGVQYDIDTTYVVPPDPIPLERVNNDHVRIITHNVLYNGLFDPERQPRFQRILTALDADVMAFQEAWGDVSQIVPLISSWMPGITWYISAEWNGKCVVSRYPILNEAVLINSERSMCVLLDTEDLLGKNLLIINSHFSCCDNNEERQQQADELISVLREWREGNGPFDLPDETPIIHLGDFNLVGYHQQLITLTEGDIVDESTYGEDFPPDWDGTSITDLFSRHTAIRMGYTWRSDGSSFSPGKLDYILYTDSVLEPGNHYVLNTLAMSPSDLINYGLESDDTNEASDHLPRVMDIAEISSAGFGQNENDNVPTNVGLFPAYPNPFNMTTTISFQLPERFPVNLAIYDLSGRKIITVADIVANPGCHSVMWNGKNDSGTEVSSGIYLCRLEAGQFIHTNKLILLK